MFFNDTSKLSNPMLYYTQAVSVNHRSINYEIDLFE